MYDTRSPAQGGRFKQCVIELATAVRTRSAAVVPGHANRDVVDRQLPGAGCEPFGPRWIGRLADSRAAASNGIGSRHYIAEALAVENAPGHPP